MEGAGRERPLEPIPPEPVSPESSAEFPDPRWWQFPVGGPGCPGCAADREREAKQRQEDGGG